MQMRIEEWNSDTYVFTGLYSNEAANALNFILEYAHIIGAVRNAACGGYAMRYLTGEIIIMAVYRGWAESIIDNLKEDAKEILTTPKKWLLYNTKSDTEPWFWQDVVTLAKLIKNAPVKRADEMKLVGHPLNPFMETRVKILYDEIKSRKGTLKEIGLGDFKRKIYELVVEAMANGT